MVVCSENVELIKLYKKIPHTTCIDINKNEIFGILLKKAKDFFSSISVLKDYKDGSLKEIERAEKIAGDTLEADYNREY